MGEDAVQAEKSSTETGNGTVPETQELVVPCPSPSQSPVPSPIPKDSKHDGSQVHAITVLTLLDKLVNMLDTVQENQQKMEQHQVDMESSVKGIQNDITKLSKAHNSTSNTVSKLLEKSRKVSVNMKEVRERMEKQGSQVKKLEENHTHLLKRNNFKVLIFQDQNEIPTNVFMKQPTPVPSIKEGQVDENKFREETLHTVDLSSDEEVMHEDDDLEEPFEEEKLEKSRTEKFKSSSLRKVDSIKKAFSRQNIEKKMNKIGTKIVSPERREKIKKSLTPSHQKTSSTKSSKFKVSPITLGIKKVRDEETPAVTADQSVIPSETQPKNGNEDAIFEGVHSEMSPATVVTEEVKAAADLLEREMPERNVLVNNNNIELTIVEGNEEVEMTLQTSGPEKYIEEDEEEEEEETALTVTEEEEQPTEESVKPAVLHIEQMA